MKEHLHNIDSRVSLNTIKSIKSKSGTKLTNEQLINVMGSLEIKSEKSDHISIAGSDDSVYNDLETRVKNLNSKD